MSARSSVHEKPLSYKNDPILHIRIFTFIARGQSPNSILLPYDVCGT
jgi:hypothetical protein